MCRHSRQPTTQSREDDDIRPTIDPQPEPILLSRIGCAGGPDPSRERLSYVLSDATVDFVADRSGGPEAQRSLQHEVSNRYPHPLSRTKTRIRARLRRTVVGQDANRGRHRRSWENPSVDHIHPAALCSSHTPDDSRTIRRSCRSRKGTGA